MDKKQYIFNTCEIIHSATVRLSLPNDILLLVKVTNVMQFP